MKNEKPLSIRLYEQYTERLDQKTDQEIIKAFNREAGNCGWGTARASYLGALHDQLEKRNFDYSEIGDSAAMSIESKIKREGKVIKTITDPPDINPNNCLWKTVPDKNDPRGYRIERLC